MSFPLARTVGALVALSVLGSVATAGDPISTPYDPPWADAKPLNTIQLDFDPALTEEANASILDATIQALQPGDRLEVGAGVWRFNFIFDVNVQGTPQDPIWIVAQDGTEPIIARVNANQNLMNVGVPSQGGPSRFLCIRGFRFVGGSAGVRLYNCSDIWFDDNTIRQTNDAALTANTFDTDHLYITRNDIAFTGGPGEGMYLGGNNSSVIMSHSVIALNYVHDTEGTQGDGIEVKQGSFGNWIAENLVENTGGPCVLVYGTDGKERNLIERNRLFQSGDNVLQVQGEAIVRNNLAIGGIASAFWSHDHQGMTQDLSVTNNTFINVNNAATLVDWGGRPGMVLIDNAFYSKSAKAIRFQNGSDDVFIKNNAFFGAISGATVLAPKAIFPANGLAEDFVDVDFLGFMRDAQPRPTGALAGAGSFPPKVADDLFGQLRDGDADVGALSLSSFGPHYGEGLAGTGGVVPRILVNSLPELGNANFRILLSHAPPGELALLGIGVLKTEIELFGGVLWTLPVLNFFQVTNANGVAGKDLPLPVDPTLAGVPVHAQWWVTDAAAPVGWAMTDGIVLNLTIPN